MGVEKCHCMSPDKPSLSLQKPKDPDMCFPDLCSSARLSDDSIWDTGLDQEQREAEVLQISFHHQGVASGILRLGDSGMELRVQRSSGQWQPGQQPYSNQTVLLG